MPARLKAQLRRLGKIEKSFLAVLILAVVGKYAFPASDFELLLSFTVFALFTIVAFKWLVVGMKRAIWRLRYRLLVAYVFIAVVPILLIGVLVWFGAYVLTGQVAAYLVLTELERQTADLLMPARGLAWTDAATRPQYAKWVAPAFWHRFSGMEMAARDRRGVWRYPENSTLEPPPAGWGDVSGLVRKDDKLYLWAHAGSELADVTMIVPVTSRLMAELLPSLGELSFRKHGAGAPPEALSIDKTGVRTRVPPPESTFDREVFYATVVPVALWDAPGKFDSDALFLWTRSSAVLRTIFGQKLEWRPGEAVGSFAAVLFVFVATVFLIVELVSVVIGVRLTRSITGAVHNLYVGTQHVREGDFAHRIEVQGKDQLAELTQSFNRMTENLQQLVEVAKEKERLQAEIEIAREVQNQLFPKSMPVSRTLELAAMCLPARLVSGDYYDYLNLEESKLAFAIGDVAGKGISAALLMATVQSTMRTQLHAGREMAAAAVNGGPAYQLSTAVLVSRLNQQLYAFTSPEKYATFWFALYDDVSGLMTYTNAGHLPPLLVRDGAATRLEVTGTVVGAFSFAEYGEASVVLEPGDLLVCFTDGVTEPENEFGEMFGEDRLSDLVVKHAHSPSDEIIRAVMESVRHWTGSPELQDDMTLLLARRV